MVLFLAAVAGFLAGRFLWLVLRPTLRQPLFARENHRGATVPTGGGLVLVLTVLGVEAGRVVAGAAGVGERPGVAGARLLVLLAVTGFGLLGLVDDLAGAGPDRGFRGHVGALGKGRVTTGMLKLLGGAAVAVVVVAPRSGGGLGRLLLDAALVALTANLGNLLDRAPGRTLKVASVAFLALAVATTATTRLSGVAVAAAAGLALLFDDLREHVMLGDTGANAIGAALGLGLVLACAPGTRTLALIVVAVLNVASEVLPFSRVIDAVPPLRALDQMGRRRSP